MYDNEQVILKYCDENGNEIDVNGSDDNIAGICNKNKNVFGLMPHPERAMESILGGVDGVKMLQGFIKWDFLFSFSHLFFFLHIE